MSAVMRSNQLSTSPAANFAHLRCPLTKQLAKHRYRPLNSLFNLPDFALLPTQITISHILLCLLRTSVIPLP